MTGMWARQSLAALAMLLGGCVQLAPPQLERETRAAITVALRDFVPADGSALCVVDDVPITRFIPHSDEEPLLLLLRLEPRDLGPGMDPTRRDDRYLPNFVPVPEGCSATVKLEASYFERDNLQIRYSLHCGDLCGEGGAINLTLRNRQWRVLNREVGWMS